MDFVNLCADFNRRIRSFLGDSCSLNVAGDMKDCFHHLPCLSVCEVWDSISEYWAKQGVHFISVPRRARASPARLGKFEEPGTVVLTFLHVRNILEHFVQTNFVTLGNAVGRECKGAPMGDALSNAVLKLFKWSREAACRRAPCTQTQPRCHGARAALAAAGRRRVPCPPLLPPRAARALRRT